MIHTATKKPVTVEFVQYDGSNHQEIIEFTEGAANYDVVVGSSADGKGGKQLYSKLSILTKEGEMLVSVNDYVIKEPSPTEDRKFYPCKPQIFLSIYDISNGEAETNLSELPDDSWFLRMVADKRLFIHRVSTAHHDDLVSGYYCWKPGYTKAFIYSEAMADLMVGDSDSPYIEKVKVSKILNQHNNDGNNGSEEN